MRMPRVRSTLVLLAIAGVAGLAAVALVAAAPGLYGPGDADCEYESGDPVVGGDHGTHESDMHATNAANATGDHDDCPADDAIGVARGDVEDA